MKTITNNRPREVLTWYDLTEKERDEFDYFNANDEVGSFARYKGNCYDLNDSERPSSTLFPEWDGYYSETFFSGVLFRFVPDTDFEEVIMGRYLA